VSAQPEDRPPAAVVVLAAGEGTRMRSSRPKVLHEVGGRSLLGHVLAAAGQLEPQHLVVVVGHGREEVVAAVDAASPGVQTVVQAEQRGTGHALRVALEALPDLAADDEVVVVSGDAPLLTADSLRRMLDAHRGAGASATLLTALLEDPSGYGRVLRADDGSVGAVVEDRDADEDQLAVREVNGGAYVFVAGPSTAALSRLGTGNTQAEEYLTDVVHLLAEDGHVVVGSTVDDPVEVLGVNDRAQLAAVGALLRDRVLRGWMLAGVTVVDPATTWVDVTVTLEPDAVILPGTQLHGTTSVAAGAVIGPDSTLRDVQVGTQARVVRSQLEECAVGTAASVGPFSFVRAGTRLGAGGKIGGFVETKNAVIGAGSKVPHLSYVGDAEIGEGSNIGAATVFVNYDGVDKHRTVVGDHVRIGSDTMLVAPVVVGDGAYTAAGSVITEDVPPGAMAVGRAKQRTIRGWVARRRAGSPSARAAERAETPEGAQSSPTTPVAERASAKAPTGPDEGQTA
jgi:bifunctional UDP-N-acetylglucosamine pyrophosphorylase/glucosamine-1-phosphate N-acetyltransferase